MGRDIVHFPAADVRQKNKTKTKPNGQGGGRGLRAKEENAEFIPNPYALKVPKHNNYVPSAREIRRSSAIERVYF